MAYYDFVSNAHGEPSAKLIARSTLVYTTRTASSTGEQKTLPVGNADAEYVTASSGVITFKKACKILLHYEVSSVASSTWVKMELYKNNDMIGSTVQANNGQYQRGYYVMNMAKDDTIEAKAWAYDTAGGSVPHYTIYVLTEE